MREELPPHAIRVRRYIDRFYELTERPIAIAIDDPRLLSDPALLRNIESTFEQLLDSIASMPESTRRADSQGNPHVYTRLEPGLFGDNDTMHDVKDAQQTLRMLFDRKRAESRQR